MSEEAEIPVEKLVKVYLKMTTKKSEIDAAYKAEVEKLKEQMDRVKAHLLVYCKNQNVESVRTAEGLFYRTVKTTYSTNDWESMRKFIIQNEVPELLHERIHQSNMKQFLEENPELLPPGLNVDSEYTITVRRK
jgi:phage host-nuclease inhibitor protein Gam